MIDISRLKTDFAKMTEQESGTVKMNSSITNKLGEVAKGVGGDIVDGAWLTAAQDTARTVRELIARVVTSHFGEKGASVVKFLDTDEGLAALCIFLGMVIPELPITQKPSLARLSKECRRLGWFKLTSYVTDPFFNEFLGIFNKFDGVE